MATTMNRRDVLKVAGGMAAGFALTAACGAGGKEPRAESDASLRTDRPNILLVVVDDANSEEFARLPVLSSGWRHLPNFIIPNPVCSPSRASYLTGQHSVNNGVFGNEGAPGPALAISGTMATAFKTDGYATGLFGKYTNFTTEDNANIIASGWSRWFGSYTTDYYGVTNRDGVVEHRGYQPRVTGRGCRNWMTAQTQPFLACWFPVAPHFSFEYEDKYADRYPGLPRKQRDRARSLLTVNEMLKKQLAALDAAGQLANTYVLVTSDNGFLWGDEPEADGETGKRQPYEESLNVTAYLRGPGISEGVDSRQWANIDVLPTFAARAGISIPWAMDGLDMLAPGADRDRLDIRSWDESFGAEAWQGWRTNTHTHVEYEDGRVLDLERP